jgi:hypothetical protein
VFGDCARRTHKRLCRLAASPQHKNDFSYKKGQKSTLHKYDTLPPTVTEFDVVNKAHKDTHRAKVDDDRYTMGGPLGG